MTAEVSRIEHLKGQLEAEIDAAVSARQARLDSAQTDDMVRWLLAHDWTVQYVASPYVGSLCLVHPDRQGFRAEGLSNHNLHDFLVAAVSFTEEYMNVEYVPSIATPSDQDGDR